MTLIQEINVYASEKIKFHGRIGCQKDYKFDAEVDIYHDSSNPMLSTYHAIGTFSNAAEAFEEIISYCKGYAEGQDEKINRVNNPCNTEFLELTEQQNIVNKLSLELTVEVNTERCLTDRQSATSFQSL